MKKLFSGIIALTLFAMSCKKDSSTDNVIVIDPPAVPWLLTKISNANDLTTFTYNADMLVENIVDDIRSVNYYSAIKMEYVTGIPVKLLAKQKPADELKQVKSFFTKDGKVTRVSNYELRNPGVVSSWDTIIYDKQHVVQVNRYKGEKDLYMVRKYTWTGENVTLAEQFEVLPDKTQHLASSTAFSYNDKRSYGYPYGSFLISEELSSPETLSANELIKVKYEYLGGTKPDVTLTTHSRSYNNSQLPVTDTIVETSGGNSSQRIFVFEFSNLPK
ncbi:hypothetical protein ECE50_007855 [Chitinophaga sp. Mgbs1]|uniref:Uncharacterized protein n=1 Tax=Chitinophaga solisilvae TaxID=1233460 RepID=A0A9Q5D2B0_9BACT|nr:hypothetical protein [Chitinophaga solisilvae]